jgi:SAM-dependent methyltransferase/uncharacterized protein YbaR (Trm112 family)
MTSHGPEGQKDDEWETNGENCMKLETLKLETLKLETLALLRCIAAPGSTPTPEPSSDGGQAIRCDGALILSDEHALICTQCGAIYSVINGIPRLLPENDAPTHYLDDETIRCYYEAHYAPYLRPTPEILDRLAFPRVEKPLQVRDGVPTEGPHTTRIAGMDADGRWSRFHQSVAQLVAEQSLTDEFYHRMVDWCRPYITNEALVLDVGCALGRMTGEIARLGAKHVIGLDRSSRMAEEAARILSARSALPVTLNMTGVEGVSACLDLGWEVDQYGIIVGDVERLPLRAGAFDVVTCLNLVDRVADPGELAEELRRVLKPGGHLIIADPYHWEEKFTARSKWIGDMAMLFDPDRWRRVREADGIPFVMRYYRRRITIYMNHCLIYRKMAEAS